MSRATGKSKREIEELIAELSPSPDVPATIRKLPECKQKKRWLATEAVARPSLAPLMDDARQLVPEPASGHVQFGTRSIDARKLPEQSQLVPDRVTFLHTSALARPQAPTQRPVVKPLAPARYKVQFTASAELREKLNRLRALMRSSVPDGDLAAIIEEAVTEKLERLEAKRFAKTKSRRTILERADTTPKSRYIPAPVRRAVRERDGNRCTFVDEHGRRCTSRDRLEFRHRDPFGRGGDHRPENLRLVCGLCRYRHKRLSSSPASDAVWTHCSTGGDTKTAAHMQNGTITVPFRIWVFKPTSRRPLRFPVQK